MPSIVQIPSVGEVEFPEGMSKEEISSAVKGILSKQKGGEQNNEPYQPQANPQGNEGRTPDQQSQPSSEGGSQAVDQSSRRDGQERIGSVNPRDAQAQELQLQVTGDIINPVAKGGESFEKDAKAESQRVQDAQGKEDGQAVRPEGDARNEAEVSKGGVQPPAPKSFLEKTGEALYAGYKGLGTAASELQRYGWDLSKGVNPVVTAAKDAEFIFGKNPFSDKVAQKVQEGDKYFADMVAGSQMTPEEAQSPVNQFTFGVGHMIGDLVEAAATEGVSAEASAFKAVSEVPIWKSIADKAVHGMKAFAVPSLVASNEAIDKAKAEGKSDEDALGLGLKTMFETEAGAALPMNVSSGLNTVIKRGASRILQSIPLAVAQSELSKSVNNVLSSDEGHENTISENLIEGNFDLAAKQLAQVAPMGLMGVLGERAKGVKEAGLPATAAVLEGKKKPITFSVDPSGEIESIYKTAEEAIAKGDRTAASLSLNAAKEAESAAENATTPEQQAQRQKRWNYLDSQIESLPAEKPEAKTSQPTTPDATKTGEVKEDTTGKYPQGDQGGQAPKTGYSHSLQPTEEGQEKIEGTRIAAAAYRDPETGIVHEGESHEDAMRNAGKTPITDPAQRETKDFGYTTDKGEFISREDAQVLAEKSGQFLGKKTDRPVMHSQEVAQDKKKEQMTRITPQQYGPGASAGAELYNKDVQLGAQIVQGKKGISFEKWRELFEPRMYEGKYEESQLRDLYERSKQVAEIADRGVPIPEAVKQIGGRPLAPRSKSALANDKINATRQSMGLSRIADIAKDTWKAVWERAMYKIDDDPYYKTNLLNRLKENPNQAVTAEDEAILHHEIISVKNKYDQAIDALQTETDPSRIAERKAEVRNLEDQYDQLTLLSKQTGRATGQALNMRKALIADDFTLLGMLRKAKSEIAGRAEEDGGAELSEESRKKIEEQAKRIEELEKQLDERTQAMKSEMMDEDLEDFTKEAKAESKETDPLVQRIVDKLRSTISDQAEAARQRIAERQKGGKLFADVTGSKVALDTADYAIIGADYISKGLTDFAKWSSKMVEEFGDYIKPYLERIFKEANDHIDKQADILTQSSADKRASKKEIKQKIKQEAKRTAAKSPDEKIQKYLNEIREDPNDFERVGSLVRSLAKAVHQKAYRSGNDLNRNQFADAVHKIVSKEIDGWTEANTKEAMVGYGIFKRLSKDAETVRLRELNGEIREIAKQGDIRKGQAPKKSAEFPPKAVGERIEIKKNKALIKKFGIQVKDPATELAGMMDSIKNRLRNHIEELNRRIETGERPPKKMPIEYDAESKALKAERDALQQHFDTLYGKSEKTMEEKVAAYEIANQKLIEAKTKFIAEEKERIAAGKKMNPKQKEKITSPKIEEQKEQINRLNEEAKSVRDSDYARREEIKGNAAGKRIETIQAEIAGMKKTRQKEQTVPSKALAFIQDRLAEAEKRLKAFRDSQKVKKTEDEKILQGLENKKKSAEARLSQLQSEEKKPSGAKQMVFNREQRAVQNEIDDINKQIKEYQDANKKRLTQEEKNINSLQRRIDSLEKQRETRGAKEAPKEEAYVPSDRELALQKELEQLKQDVKGDDWYINNREKVALNAYKVRLLRRRDEYIRRSAEKDFAPRVKLERAVNPEIEKLKTEFERVKSEFEQDRILDRWQNRNNWEKAADLAIAWKRFAILSYAGTLAKLFVASVNIATFKIPAYVFGRLIAELPGFREIAKLAPSEGGGNISQDVKNYTKGLWEGLQEFKDIAIKQQDSKLSLLHKEISGEAESKIPKGALNMPGKIHEAIKNPTKLAVYKMSFARHLDWMQKNGIEVFGEEGEAARQKASIEAFKDANRSIFMEDNSVVRFYNNIVSQAQKSKNRGIRGAGYAAQELVPIVKIPTNVVKQVFEYTLGVPIGGVRGLMALAKGVESLSPEQANSILRQMKTGSVGLTMFALGAALPNYFGGFYRKNATPEEGEPGFDEMKIGGFVIPKTFMHHPALIAGQIGATMRKVWDEGAEGIEDSEGMVDLAAKAGYQAMLGVVTELPFVNVSRDLQQTFDPKRVGSWSGNFVRSNIPGFVQEIAKAIDRDEDGNLIKRKPEGFLETVEQGLPWLRETATPK